MLSTLRHPSLRIVKQTALSEEKVTKRGKTSLVFVVVKNSPFQLTVALIDACHLTNFNQLTFEIALIYDMPGVNKEVSYVSTKPVDYKPSLNDVGDEICFDVKIKVLSSHHEDNFFRLKVIVWDPTSDYFPQLEILSNPIKVISKPMNQRKTRKRSASTSTPRRTTSRAVSNDVDPPSPPTVAPISVPIVSPINTMIETSLSKVESQQQETLRLLHELLNRTPDPQQQIQQQHQQQQLQQQLQQQQQQQQLLSLSANYTFPSTPNQQEGRPAKRMKLESSTDDFQIDLKTIGKDETPAPVQDFEALFSGMLQLYAAMSAEEKAERIRKLLRNLSSRDHEQLEEMWDIMGTTGLRSNLVSSASYASPGFNILGYPPSMNGSLHSESCNESCPHRMELVKIDQFYNEVFF